MGRVLEFAQSVVVVVSPIWSVTGSKRLCTGS